MLCETPRCISVAQWHRDVGPRAYLVDVDADFVSPRLHPQHPPLPGHEFVHARNQFIGPRDTGAPVPGGAFVQQQQDQEVAGLRRLADAREAGVDNGCAFHGNPQVLPSLLLARKHAATPHSRSRGVSAMSLAGASDTLSDTDEHCGACHMVSPADDEDVVSGAALSEPEAVNQHVRKYGFASAFVTHRDNDYAHGPHANVIDWLVQRHAKSHAYVVLDTPEYTVRLETASREIAERYIARVGCGCTMLVFGPPPVVYPVNPEPWDGGREYIVPFGLPADAMVPFTAVDLDPGLYHAIDPETRLVHAVAHDAEVLRQEYPYFNIARRNVPISPPSPSTCQPPPVAPVYRVDWTRVQAAIHEHYAEVRAQCRGMPWALVDLDGITVRCAGSSLEDVMEQAAHVPGMVVCVAPETPGASLGPACVLFTETR